MTTVAMPTLTELRRTALDALAPVDDNDPAILPEIVDSLTPPALMVLWDDPWLEQGVTRQTMSQCMWRARLRVLCIAWRYEPGPAYDKLDELVALVLDRMRSDAHTWTLDRVGAPGVFLVSNIPYLAANVSYWTETTI